MERVQISKSGVIILSKTVIDDCRMKILKFDGLQWDYWPAAHGSNNYVIAMRLAPLDL